MGSGRIRDPSNGSVEVVNFLWTMRLLFLYIYLLVVYPDENDYTYPQFYRLYLIPFLSVPNAETEYCALLDSCRTSEDFE